MSGLNTFVKLQGSDLITGSVQDCVPILEDATARRNEGHHGSNEMRHAARFPEVIVERYCNEQGIEFSEFMRDKVHIRRMLADPALSGFRIWEGRVS
jgi:hypothetical protein